MDQEEDMYIPFTRSVLLFLGEDFYISIDNTPLFTEHSDGFVLLDVRGLLIRLSYRRRVFPEFWSWDLISIYIPMHINQYTFICHAI
jgi:hypothetical protein